MIDDIQYTNCSTWGNSILLRGIDRHTRQRVLQRVKFEPTLYKRTDKHTEIHSLSGVPVEAVEFDSIKDCKDYVKSYEGVKGREIFGNTNVLQQYMSTLDNNANLDLLNIATVDIETTVEFGKGMPSLENCNEKILLITLKWRNRSDYITLGVKPYTGTPIPNCVYKHCKDEASLLKEFVSIWKANYPDVVTGWNSDGFDIPYIYARLCAVHGEDFANQLSPWNEVFVDRSFDDTKQTTITIVGISQLDMLALYKKYTPGSRESYKLGYIAEYEKLPIQKQTFTDVSGGFYEMYTDHWDRFVSYNVDDVRVVVGIDDKLNLINLHVMVAYEARTNFEDAFSPVRTWESIIYNHFERNGIVFDPHKRNPARAYEGAYVKVPTPGLYGYCSSVDATALYPSIMMTYNVSPECFVGMQPGISVDMLLSTDNDVYVEGHAVCANGATFRTDVVGFIPYLIQHFMTMRSSAKTVKLDSEVELANMIKNHADANQVSAINSKIALFDTKQSAFKTLLNALYGALAEKSFRFFDVLLAEGITLTGQYLIRSVENSIQRHLNSSDVSVVYSDTDSIYFDLNKIYIKYIQNTKLNPVKAIEKYVVDIIQPAVASIVEHALDRTGFKVRKIHFKLEGIGDRLLMVSKKRYVMRVLYNEGVIYAKPKLKIIGLEIVRSSTPKIVQNALRDSINYILDADVDGLRKHIDVIKREFMSADIQIISSPTGVNGLLKYTGENGMYIKGTPMHVRAAILYNNLIKKHGLETKYALITESSKMKMILLKMPNTVRENVIGFSDTLPTEFELEYFIDRDSQFDKVFTEPLLRLTDAANMKLIETSTLEDFFG